MRKALTLPVPQWSSAWSPSPKFGEGSGGLFAGEHDLNLALAQRLHEGIGGSGVSDDDVDIGGRGETYQVIIAQLAGVTHDHYFVGIGDEGGFDGCLLGVGRRQAMVQGKGIGTDKGDVGTHHSQGAQCGIANDGLGNRADRTAK